MATEHTTEQCNATYLTMWGLISFKQVPILHASKPRVSAKGPALTQSY